VVVNNNTYGCLASGLGCQTKKIIKQRGNGGAKQGEKRSKKALLF